MVVIPSSANFQNKRAHVLTVGPDRMSHPQSSLHDTTHVKYFVFLFFDMVFKVSSAIKSARCLSIPSPQDFKYSY